MFGIPSRRSSRQNRHPVRSVLSVETLEKRELMAADMVVQWNNHLIDVIRQDSTLPGPAWVSRNMGIVQAAVYDSVNAITKTHTSYLTQATAPTWASQEAAVAQSAHDVIVALYPQQTANVDQMLRDSLAKIPDGAAEDAGVAIGKQVAAEVVLLRVNDGSKDPSSYTPSTQPGKWQPDPLNPTQTALAPNWGQVTPFAIQNPNDFQAPPPPALDSAEYAAAFNEVKSLGAKNSTTRTVDQTQVGVFWAYDRGGMGPPMILYNQNVQQIAELKGNTLAQNARLFALVNLAMADSGIVAWNTKYTYDLWRPITAIRNADLDGNAATIVDRNWTPLGAPGGGVVPDFTPPFPAYTSGHATFGAAAFNVLADFYGSDRFNYSLTSDELPGVTRRYTTFSQAAAENGVSRIYLGIHWNFDNTVGQHQGRRVADYVFDNYLLPVSTNRAQIGVRMEGGGFATTALPVGVADVSLRKLSDRLQVVDNKSGKVVFSAPASKATEVRFDARSSASDILTVDWAYGGVVNLAKGIRYLGNQAGGERFWYADTHAAGVIDLSDNTLVLPGTIVNLQGVTYVGLAGHGGNDRFTIRGEQRNRRIDILGAAGDDQFNLWGVNGYYAIKDTAGVDALDFSQMTSGASVDLSRSTGAKQILGAGNSIEIHGELENVTGTAYNDYLAGNASNNIMLGLNGHDRLYGRAGHDRLLGGDGNDILVGGLGNDELLGGSGHDLLIGGAGADVLQGDAGENILIAGSTTHDANDAALTAIAAEWTSATPLAARRANLSNGSRSATRKNGNYFLTTTGRAATVLNDGAVDTLFGAGDNNWRLASYNDRLRT